MARRVLFLTKYGPKGASSRYRAYQYWDFLQEAGYTCVASPLFPDDFLTRKYGAYAGRANLAVAAPSVLASLARRWRLIRTHVAKYDLVYLECEALPYLPFHAERALFTTGPPVVVDYGDAIAVAYGQHRIGVVRRFLASKIPRVLGRGAAVIAANRHLATWACRYNANVTVIPTCVDLRRYPPEPAARPGEHRPIIGWIGTPITAQYLRLLAQPLRALRARHDFTLRVIGAPDFNLDGISVDAVPWDESSEVEELRKCDIGVMPLPDDQWTRGKSSLKVIQYMAAGVPAVASAVGTNREVLTDGETGYLATAEAEWVEKLSLLIEDPSLRRNMAQAARGVVEASYSLQGNAPSLARVFTQAMYGPKPGLTEVGDA